MQIEPLAWKALSILLLAASLVAMGVLLLWQLFVLGVDGSTDTVWWLLGSLASIMGIFWASIVAHELGHLLAALASRMHVLLLVLGPVKFVREDGRFRLRFNWRSPTPGLVLAIPRETHALRRRMLLYASGSLASFVAILLAGE